VDLAASLTTVGEAVDAINLLTPDTIRARINDNGDGIVIEDTSGGDGALAIEDIEGRFAAGFRLAGTAAAGENFIDGSFEIRIDIGAGDTLDTIVRKINNAGGDFSASILNDGGAANPFSLTISSTVSGRAGEMVIDTGALDLGFTTLSAARDAVITVGGADAADVALITSSSNSLEGVIEGVTLDLQSASDEDVNITIDQDLDSIIESIKEFVARYNEVQDTIDGATSFDTETMERGPLLGDRTVSQVRSRLHNIMLRPFEGGSETVSRMFSVGLKIGGENRLEFDEDRFREVYANSPDLVEELFAQAETGFGAVIQDALEEMTRDADGLIAQRNDLLADQQELLNDRIDALNLLLDDKRARLEAQFVALERSLAMLQGQQSSLSALAQLAGGGGL
jgi:flagellar hook-associated protein 2